MFQQGGQMNDEQKAFTAYLIKVLNPKDTADFENKVAQLSEEDLKEFYNQYKAMEGNQISMAKLGAKLSYVQTLRGECPEGYEVEKFLAGGCVKCRKKAEGIKVVDIFKDKCGGKARKRVKKDQRGAVVNKADTTHTGMGIYNTSNKNQANEKGASKVGVMKNIGIGKNYFGGTIQRRIIKQ